MFVLRVPNLGLCPILRPSLVACRFNRYHTDFFLISLYISRRVNPEFPSWRGNLTEIRSFAPVCESISTPTAQYDALVVISTLVCNPWLSSGCTSTLPSVSSLHGCSPLVSVPPSLLPPSSVSLSPSGRSTCFPSMGRCMLALFIGVTMWPLVLPRPLRYFVTPCYGFAGTGVCNRTG